MDDLDKPLFPCQCDMDEDCSRECEMQMGMEDGSITPYQEDKNYVDPNQLTLFEVNENGEMIQ